MAHKSSNLQTSLNRFLDASKLFGLTIGLGNTKVLFKPAPNSSTPHPTNTTDGVEMKTVKSFKYIGSVISSDGQLDKEISARISKASKALGRLQQGTHTPQCVPDFKAENIQSCSPHITALWLCILDYVLLSHQAAVKVPYLSTLFHPGYLIAGQLSLISKVLDWANSNLHWSNAAESLALLGWQHHLNGWWAHTKTTVLWWTSTRKKKTRLSIKALQGHTQEQPEMVWHEAFQTPCSSPGPPLLACTHMHSKCVTGKGAMSRTACSLWSSAQSCFYPCHNSSLQVSHLPLTLQIQTGATDPFQSPLTEVQTKSFLNPRDNHHNVALAEIKHLQWQDVHISKEADKCKSKKSHKHPITQMNMLLPIEKLGMNQMFLQAIMIPHTLHLYILYESHNTLGHNGSTIII